MRRVATTRREVAGMFRFIDFRLWLSIAWASHDGGKTSSNYLELRAPSGFASHELTSTGSMSRRKHGKIGIFPTVILCAKSLRVACCPLACLHALILPRESTSIFATTVVVYGCHAVLQREW